MKVLCITEKIYPTPTASARCLKNILDEKNIESAYIIVDIFNDYVARNNTYRIKTSQCKIKENLKKIFKNEKLLNFFAKVCNKLEKFIHVKYYNLSVYHINKKEISKVLKNIDLKSFDYLISVSNPFVCQYVANYIKKTEPSLKWVAYEVDPYVYNCCAKKRNVDKKKKFADEIYKNVDKLFCMPTIKEFNEKNEYFASYHKNSVMINLPCLKFSNYSTEKSLDKIICTYSGYFYKNIRNPQFLLKIFSKLPENIYLQIIGNGCEKDIDEYKKIMGDRLIIKGHLEEKECTQLIYNSNFLINIGNNVVNQIPSKIFFYFSTGLPIVNIYDIDEDTSIKYLQEYGLSLNLDKRNNFEENVLKLQNFINDNANSLLLEEEIKKRMKDYLLENISDKFFKELENI